MNRRPSRSHPFRPVARQLAAPLMALGVFALVGLGPREAGAQTPRSEEPAASERLSAPREAPAWSGLGLSGELRLGLPSARYDVLERELYHSRGGPPPSYPGRALAWPWRGPRGRHLERLYAYPWYPWYPLPQTHRTGLSGGGEEVFGSGRPRLGLHQQHPYLDTPTSQGLQLPPEAYDAPPAEPLSPLEEALALFRSSQFRRAGQILSGELKTGRAPLEVYLLLTELLAATENFEPAARLLRFGIEGAEALFILDAVDIAAHFPSRERFDQTLAKLDGRIEQLAVNSTQRKNLRFLAGALRLLSRDRARGLREIEALQDDPLLGEVSRIITLHFLAAFFEEEKREAGDVESPAPRPDRGADEPSAAGEGEEAEKAEEGEPDGGASPGAETLPEKDF